MFADLDALTVRVLAAVQQAERPAAAAVRFLLRQYRHGDEADLGDPLGVALAAALIHHADDVTTRQRADWLRLFGEAAALSDDERLVHTVTDLAAGLADDWPAITVVGDASTSIDACLGVLPLVDAEALVPRAVDQIERVVGGAYQPGVGVMHALGDRSRTRGAPGDQVLAASALLTAFEVTGRLPYSMLAEELMQLSRADFDADVDVDSGCAAVAVWCRLAALHDDAAYRGAAVIAAAADYDADARRMLERMSTQIETTVDFATYGIAMSEWRARASARHETP